MASQPGILSEWPWAPLGSFKYLILGPWVVHATYQFIWMRSGERDLGYFLIFPLLLVRLLHNQIWISVSRYRTAKGTSRIVDKGIEFEQVDRESNWDDQILLNGLLFYVGKYTIPGYTQLPLWRTDGLIITTILHVGAVEFLYYWLHRAFHHHFLYSRYHSHHHSAVVTEPTSAVNHPFAEEMAYFLLFAIPVVTTMLTKTASIASYAGYIVYIDLMDNIGHCNFEFFPKWLVSGFPPIKYLMYTPTFHSLHHTQFRTNYCLFMPIYDYIYGTMDKSNDSAYEAAIRRPEELPNVVHLTHFTDPESLHHLRLGFASLASQPESETSRFKWYSLLIRPFAIVFSWIYSHSFILDRNSFKKLNLQSWVVPRFNGQYLQKDKTGAINGLIEEAILEADKKGVRVLSLGLRNQGEELNQHGELYIRKHPKLRIKLVDGTSLAAAIVLKAIPKGTNRVLLGGKLNKVSSVIAKALCQSGVQVECATDKIDVQKLKSDIDGTFGKNLVYPAAYSPQIWIVGDGLTDEEQSKALSGTIFIPFSQFPPKRLHKDCFYHSTPAMVIPSTFKNMHSCENWLARRVMSAWRIAGIIHALEGWQGHECGQTVFDLEKMWEAALHHGFQPLMIPNAQIASP